MKSKIIILLMFMLLLVPTTFAVISNVNPIIGYNQATFNWTSDVIEFGQVYYGVGALLTNVVSEGASTNNHSVLINGLIPETIYSYRIRSGIDYYPSNITTFNFTTTAGGLINTGAITFTREPVPQFTKNATVAIIGTADAGTLVRVSRNLSGTWYAQELILPNGSTTYFFDVNIFDYSFQVGLQEGNNNLRIEYIDSITSNREIEYFNVFSDVTPPSLSLIPIPTYVKGEIKFLGITEENTTFQVLLDNRIVGTVQVIKPTANISTSLKSIGFNVGNNFYFNQSVSFSEEGWHNLTLQLTDFVGNILEAKYNIYIDITPPELENISIVTIFDETVSKGIGGTSKLWTPFNPVNLMGIATDNSGNENLDVIILNNRNDSNCDFIRDELQDKIDNIYYSESLKTNDQGGYESLIEGQVSLFASALGNTGATVSPDKDGEFETTLSLMSPNILKNESVKDNNICIFAVDMAGNIASVHEVITYEPTSSIWAVNNYEVDPNEIFSSWLKHADYSAMVMFDLEWMGGRDFEKVDRLNIKVDVVDDGIDQIGEVLVSYLADAEPVFVKDESSNNYKVVIPFFIKQQMDANNILYEQDKMQFSFKMYIDYTYDGVSQTQQMQFAQATFAVETPYDIANWLTPELVNEDLIPFLNDTRSTVETMSNFTYDYLITYS